MKKNITLFLLGATPALFAAIDAGTYQNETLDALILNQTDTDSTWTFDNVTFTNTGDVRLGNSSSASYNIELTNTSANLSQINFSRNLGDTTFSVQGTSENRSQVNITGGNWKFYINTSKTAESANTTKLALGGYADLKADTFCMASDAGFVAGNGIVDISGASNTFTIANNTYMGRAAQTDTAMNVVFNISGEQGAKSVATFGGDLSLTSAGKSQNEFNMKGNADVIVSSKRVNIGNDISGGSFKFEISGENNLLHSAATTNNWNNNFFVAGAATSGKVEFIIGGKNNTLTVDSIAWIGTEKADADTEVIFKVEGTGHQIRFNSNLNFRKLDLNQTTVIFAADKDGTSTINAKALTTFTADLEIDFTNFIGNESGIYEINLISADTDWSSRASRFVGNSENYEGDASVLTGDNCLSWEIKYEDNNLTFIYEYSYIPEPSTYAAIFGTLALALVIYRRRK